jgi:hypothetical protein
LKKEPKNFYKFRLSLCGKEPLFFRLPSLHPIALGALPFFLAALHFWQQEEGRTQYIGRRITSPCSGRDKERRSFKRQAVAIQI